MTRHTMPEMTTPTTWPMTTPESARWIASPWLGPDDARDWLGPDAPALAGDIDVDAAVIGAGYAGLSTALALRREGLSVAVLEARVAGFGASGRNAGHLTPTIGKDLPTLALLYGHERTRALVAFAEHAIAHVERLIRGESGAHGGVAIDCDYEPVGNVFAAVHPRQLAAIDKAARAAERHGAPGRVLEPGDMRARGLPDAFLRGFFEPSGGVLNPAKLARGLRRAAIAAGAALHENTPVLRIDVPTASASIPATPATGGSGGAAGRATGRATGWITVRCPRGRVRARHLFVTTNAYTGRLGLRELGVRYPNIARVAVQLCRTAPLAADRLAALPWREREGIYTAHEILESHRLTADDRIVSGSKIVRYAYGGRAIPDVESGVGARLEAVLRRRFPSLADVPVTDHWGGSIAVSLDFLPQVGRAVRHPNILYAAGFCGHGVAHATYAGQMLADLLCGRDGPGSPLWTRRSVPIPPEPLGWLVARALIGVFETIDRRADR